MILRVFGVIGLGALLMSGCGDAEDSSQEAPVRADLMAEPAGASEDVLVVGDVHRARVEGRDLTVDVRMRPSYRRPPGEVPPVDGETLLHLERWLDQKLGRSIGWSVQVDPGDEANLFELGVIDTFEGPLGTWTVHKLGEDTFAHYMAMSRFDGLVFQVVGGAPNNPVRVIEIAQSMELSTRWGT